MSATPIVVQMMPDDPFNAATGVGLGSSNPIMLPDGSAVAPVNSAGFPYDPSGQYYWNNLGDPQGWVPVPTMPIASGTPGTATAVEQVMPASLVGTNDWLFLVAFLVVVFFFVD